MRPTRLWLRLAGLLVLLSGDRKAFTTESREVTENFPTLNRERRDFRWAPSTDSASFILRCFYMAILVNKDTRVVVQGLTGREGTFHAKASAAYGTKIVGGVTPGKG